MAIFVEGDPGAIFGDFVRNVQEAQSPNSMTTLKMESDMVSIVQRDHERMMIADIDRDGIPRAPLAESTLANKNRGSGPSLIPRWTASRFMTRMRTFWLTRGQGRTLVKGFEDIVNDQGQSFAQYHLEGATKPGTRWVLPKRDVGGVSPRGMDEIRTRYASFASEILRDARQARISGKPTLGARIRGFFGRFF